MNTITIVSTMTGKTWEGELPHNVALDVAAGHTAREAGATCGLESIFRLFNRVNFEDTQRLEQMGYELPSLSGGDFVQVDGQWWLCASSGWKRVTARQVLMTSLDYSQALAHASRNGTYADQVRPPMFLAVHNGDLVYMRPNGGWRMVPQSGGTTDHKEHPLR